MSNHYYSGQGSLYVAERDAVTGKPKGFMALGNIPDLTIDIEVTKFEHKESETGNRLLDQTIVKEKKGKFKFKLENLTLDNLALGLYGASTAVVGAAITNEEVVAYHGKRLALAHPKISAVAVESKVGAAAAARVNTTAYLANDYYVPAAANAHYYKCTVGGTSAGTPPTFTTDGSTFTDGTATFKDMGLIIKALNTDYTIDANNGMVIPVLAGSIVEGETISVDYTHAGYDNMEAFTSAVSPERWLRFEGLNTIDGSRVVVDCFRASFDPLTNYGLINEEMASVEMAGSLLADSFQLSGSQFFRQRNIAA